MPLSGDITERLVRAVRQRNQISIARWRRPDTLEQAYAVQRFTLQQLGLTPVGWKVGSTNRSAQKRRGIEEPVFGRLFESLIFQEGDVVPVRQFIDPWLEVEFAFSIGSDLQSQSGGLNRDQVIDAIEAVILSVEIADGRLENWRSCDGLSCVADNVAHGAAILGSKVDASWICRLAAVETRLLIDSVLVATGNGAAVLGDPLNSVVWLANALTSHGYFLRTGDIVLSGTTTGITRLAEGQSITARFAGLGELNIDIDGSGQSPVRSTGAETIT